MKCLAALCLATALPAADPLLFIYFREPANMGIFYATSDDGYGWKELHGGKPWIAIGQPGELMRDPFLTRGPDRQFHLVWTWGWRGQSIGYAHSADLVHWSEQREIPLMAGIAGTRNTWAPEIYWDRAMAEWRIVFSSVVEGRQEGNRIYSATTRDFRTVSRPEVFFDPGYAVIDATILQARGRYYMVFKDERNEPLHRWLEVASGPTLAGPWSGIGHAFTESWSEGPSVVRVGRQYIVYYDHYRDPKRYQAARSADFEHWTPMAEEVHFPEGCKHGSFLRITQKERRRIEAAKE